MKHFIGVDAGTSGIKVVVFNDKGEICASGYQECSVLTPQPGWVEQDPLVLWDACNSAVKMAIKNCGTKVDVASISFSRTDAGLPSGGQGPQSYRQLHNLA